MDSLKAYRDVKNSIDTALERVSTATELPLEEIQKMRNILLCPGIFFSLPTQEFFRGQGKIKVGTGTEKMKPNSSKITDGRRSASLQLNNAIR